MKDVFQWIWKLRNDSSSILFVVFLFTLVDQSFQRDILTDKELQQVFGSWRPSASEYSLFRPKVSKPSFRSKRDASGDDASLFEFNALGETFRFRIEPVLELISPKFALLGRNGSDSYFLDKHVKNCAFQGRDERQISRTIALVMCGNLRGVVTSLAEELVIEPLPENISKHGRFRRSSRHRISEHIIYRRKAHSSCPLKEGLPESPSLDQRERNYLHSRYSVSINHYNPESEKDQRLYNKETTTLDEKDDSRSKETYYIETAVFVDRDLLKHMQTNFPSNTEEEVIQVVLAMVNAVQLLYNDPSLGYKIKYVLKRLELLYQDPRGLSRPHDIDDFLTKFCSWQHLENPTQDVDPFHWDHALILTGLDLYTVLEGGKINSQVVGLAPVAGMCTRTSSCTVNEGRHFESVYVVAHEIGHNLGMRHDGLQSGNNCDPSGYLMSPTLGSGKVTWSHCSKKYFTKFLETTQSECLRDEPLRPSGELDHEGRILPGQRFSADQQCMLKYGIGSRSSTSQKPDEICRDLHCIRDQYTWTSHPALEGTQCGKEMFQWCSRGYCVDRPRAMNIYQVEEAISFLPFSSSNSASPPLASISTLNGGLTGEWGRWSECQSSCIYGIDGILSSGSTGLSASKRQCHSCHGEYRYRSCSAVRECSVRQKKTVQDFADEMCSRLIREDPSLTGNSVLLPVNGIQSCLVECLSINRSPVTTRIPFPDGTVCHSDATNFPTYCISGYCTEFRCEPNSLYGAGPHICRSNNLPLPGPLPSPIDSTSGRSSSPPPSVNVGQQSFVETITDSSGIGEQSWGPWVVSSECRFSCISQSKGIQLVSRDCLHVYGCNGLNRNIRLCTPKQTGCTIVQSPFSYANEVCQKYSKSVKQLSGFGMQLSSTLEDPNRACTVACQDASLKYRFYKVNGKDGWFPFGTECSSDKNGFDAYCLNGKCLEFNTDGTPLRNKGGQLMTRNKSRALELFTPIPLLRGFSTMKQIGDDVVESHWLVKRAVKSGETPLRNRVGQLMTRNKSRALEFFTPIPLLRDFSTRKHIGDDVVESHWLVKRDVKTTSHRLPGSFEDSFILSLIDEINATFVGNISNKAGLNSTVDLENPLFFGGIPNESSGNNTSAMDESYMWLSMSSYCSATCNEGIIVHTYHCVDGKKTIVDENLCSKVERPLTIQSCSAGVRCEKSIGGAMQNSPFERWLVGLVDEIKSTVH